MTLLEELQVARPGLCPGADHPPESGKTLPEMPLALPRSAAGWAGGDALHRGGLPGAGLASLVGAGRENAF